MRISDGLSYEEVTEIKRMIIKHFKERGITDEFLNQIKKNSDQSEYNKNLI